MKTKCPHCGNRNHYAPRLVKKKVQLKSCQIEINYRLCFCHGCEKEFEDRINVFDPEAEALRVYGNMKNGISDDSNLPLTERAFRYFHFE